MPTAKTDDTTDRLTALEAAVRIMATTLYAPNGGGTDHVAEAAAFYAAQCGDEAPAEVIAEPSSADAPAPEVTPAQEAVQ